MELPQLITHHLSYDLAWFVYLLWMAAQHKAYFSLIYSSTSAQLTCLRNFYSGLYYSTVEYKIDGFALNFKIIFIHTKILISTVAVYKSHHSIEYYWTSLQTLSEAT